MSHSLVYTKRAARDIRALDLVLQKRLAQALLELAKDPKHQAKLLIHSKIGQYRMRVGDYRIVFDLHGQEIVILRIGHRREIYR